MLLKLLTSLATLLVIACSQEVTKVQKEDAKFPNEPQVLVATPLTSAPQNGKVPKEIKEFFARQQFQPDVYGLTYLQPQYQSPRVQPQILLYGGQGQPILINPGNPPGNFLIPQGPGPNVILRNNPQGPQGAVFPVAGYPKPAHIPPIEKDAEEVPTNPAEIPPLSSAVKPTTKPTKPEKIETFTEASNQPDQKSPGVPLNPQTVNLQPGQRFFILNGDNIYQFPFEGQPEVQQEGFPQYVRYTNAQPFPQEPPKFLQPFPQEPPQYLGSGEQSNGQFPLSIQDLILRNSFVASGQPQTQQQHPPQVQTSIQPDQKMANEVPLKSNQQYFRAGPLPNFQQFSTPEDYQPAGFYISGQPQGQRTEEPKSDIIQPSIVGQFRFTPTSGPQLYQFQEDLENDAIVVDAAFEDAPSQFDRRAEGIKEEENVSGTSESPTSGEPSMAQAGPHATAIAGPGGVAGSAPRGTAIVGKGGLAVSSPQATAVAGTKDEEKKKKVKKEP
ncbi:probable serine/threonine-protein kinase DDB_G0281745 [Anthonomus grandis grandis]|uniref:probable serine/threonine-protein kinase DDB_G0281745 n=1 Tax=Anthonomus grandis grandis TaxID=2921223 RepID=UPI002165B28D|nr:probable serine/threonine-protein kinase DDB_G0281745 [Anthonomus grandis grandis]